MVEAEGGVWWGRRVLSSGEVAGKRITLLHYGRKEEKKWEAGLMDAC